MILTLRTDKPEAEVGLYTPDGTRLSYKTWPAHRELAATLLGVIRDELASQQAEFTGISGIVVLRGPGSFTGLRIGITVANTLVYGLGVPIVGGEGEQWLVDGVQKLQRGHDDQLVLPHYGAEAHITPPRT
jgi:tRNA threonylcarbamoyladenosine biosynthesis protein TsaB